MQVTAGTANPGVQQEGEGPEGRHTGGNATLNIKSSEKFVLMQILVELGAGTAGAREDQKRVLDGCQRGRRLYARVSTAKSPPPCLAGDRYAAPGFVLWQH